MSFGRPDHEQELSYGSYLRVEEMLGMQQQRSDPAQHDELLFIVIHQVYELWFKQLLHEEADEPLSRVSVPAGGEVLLVVGPEGGLTPEELALFTGRGGRPVRLGAEVLRTSTAGAAALAVLSAALGRWG